MLLGHEPVGSLERVGAATMARGPGRPNRGRHAAQEHTLPGDALPGDALPGDALPGDALPGDALPGDALPGGTLLGGTLLVVRLAMCVGCAVPGPVTCVAAIMPCGQRPEHMSWHTSLASLLARLVSWWPGRCCQCTTRGWRACCELAQMLPSSADQTHAGLLASPTSCLRRVT